MPTISRVFFGISLPIPTDPSYVTNTKSSVLCLSIKLPVSIPTFVLSSRFIIIGPVVLFDKTTSSFPSAFIFNIASLVPDLKLKTGAELSSLELIRKVESVPSVTTSKFTSGKFVPTPTRSFVSST